MSGEHIDERDLTLYHYAELDLLVSRRLEMHLAACPNCRLRLERLRQTLAAVNAPQVEMGDKALQQFTAGVMRRTERHRWGWGTLGGVSASVAVALVAVVFWLPTQPAPDGSAPVMAEMELVEKLELLQNLELLQSLPELEG